MIGTVVVTHGKIGEEMVRAVLSIVREDLPLYSVSLEQNEDVEKMRRKIEMAVQRADRGKGVLLLSDMFGGTPSNLCLSFLEEGKIEVVTGVNLPMIIKLVTLREENSLSEIADFIKRYGQKNIARAAEVLKQRSGD
ncbi:MAG: PTS sugar transporter subunit IIA [Deltaproteobacteria bacterium]|nr:PTS sugar transporter subunit IIA [Deltaproteobacteria bacterium]MBI4374263.1 PTS sugar transporter subunit IIA [Deltaproteobacteria bacterium]